MTHGFRQVSEVVGVSQPSVSRSNKYVVEQIFNKRATWIRFPSTTTAFDDAAQLWQTFKRFPMCFGAVDGTLIPVQLPPYNYNPNQFYSARIGQDRHMTLAFGETLIP